MAVLKRGSSGIGRVDHLNMLSARSPVRKSLTCARMLHKRHLSERSSGIIWQQRLEGLIKSGAKKSSGGWASEIVPRAFRERCWWWKGKGRARFSPASASTSPSSSVLEKTNGSRTRTSTRDEDDTENEISRSRKPRHQGSRLGPSSAAGRCPATAGRDRAGAIGVAPRALF